MEAGGSSETFEMSLRLHDDIPQNTDVKTIRRNEDYGNRQADSLHHEELGNVQLPVYYCVIT